MKALLWILILIVYVAAMVWVNVNFILPLPIHPALRVLISIVFNVICTTALAVGYVEEV